MLMDSMDNLKEFTAKAVKHIFILTKNMKDPYVKNLQFIKILKCASTISLKRS